MSEEKQQVVDIGQDSIVNNEPITVEERAKWEATQNLPLKVKVRNSAADMFTPNQIKFLSKGGRINMGIYGVIALTILLIIVGLNLYGLIQSGEDRPLVLINLLIPSLIFILSLEKFISGLLNSFIKKFQ